jgi:hypothetical protein
VTPHLEEILAMKSVDHLYTWWVTDRRGQTAPEYKHLVLLICLIVIYSEGEKRTLWANILQKPPTLKLKHTDYSTHNLKTPIPEKTYFRKKLLGGLNYLFTEPSHNLIIN